MELGKYGGILGEAEGIPFNMQATKPNMPTQQTVSSAIAEVVERFTGRDGIHPTAIPSVTFYRRSHPTEPAYGVDRPAFCMVAQGGKDVMFGGTTYRYDPNHYLVVSVDVPTIVHVVEATPEIPYLGLHIDFDPAEVGEMIVESGLPMSNGNGFKPGLFVSPFTTDLRDAVWRYLQLLENPQDIHVLEPLIKREIIYRLLTSENGGVLRQIAMTNSQAQSIVHAIGWLKQNYAQPLRIDEMARELHISPSSLHHMFKSITSVSPLQYQKRLRLQEARRLMLGEGLDAANAALRVGYGSPSQFSREYHRLFGAPPLSDIARLRKGSSSGDRLL
jgi:AraC-like DNA-binding protein